MEISGGKSGNFWWRWAPRLVSYSVIALVVLMLLPVLAPSLFIEASKRSRAARVRSDMRSLETAIESYHVDFGVYPAHTEIACESYREMARPGRSTFRLRNHTKLATLTTPVAYLTVLFPDAFSPEVGYLYCYYTVGGGWIQWSPGPDKEYELDPRRDYDPDRTEPSEALLKVTYDPTNGMVSDGDIWRVKQ